MVGLPFASVRLARIDGPVERWAADLARIGIDAVNMRRPDWNGGLTTLFHRFEVLVFAWDAQHSHHIAELIDMGIDGVYSDHVDRMVEVLARFGWSFDGPEPGRALIEPDKRRGSG